MIAIERNIFKLPDTDSRPTVKRRLSPGRAKKIPDSRKTTIAMPI
jgi:hypothetical protein